LVYNRRVLPVDNQMLKSGCLFGPLNSRRLGLSLGIDIIPPKTCPLNCIYCEVGRTTRLTLLRKEYVPSEEVVKEVGDALKGFPHLDHITFSGSGEPTLNSALGSMIAGIKKQTSIPVAVLTNGVLLSEKDVRRDLMEADVVLPSLDAASIEAFHCINRPHPRLNLFRIIDGLIEFRQEYPGKIWLEILFVKGVNDSPGELERLKRAVEMIMPDKVQMHTISRPAAELGLQPVTLQFLESTKDFFGGIAEVIWRDPRISFSSEQQDLEREILSITSKRAATISEIAAELENHAEAVVWAVGSMVARNKLKEVERGRTRSYEAVSLPEKVSMANPG
jgi:wyosine [tRNA(Phe)-imidazoG37] synthetase (radical SAM superfamily)